MHLPGMLRFIIGELSEGSNYMDVQKQFIVKLIWNDLIPYIISCFCLEFCKRLPYVMMEKVSKWKSERNGCLVCNCVLLKKKTGKRMVVFSRLTVYDDCEDYNACESLEKCLIDSFVNCPGSINTAEMIASHHVNGPLS